MSERDSILKYGMVSHSQNFTIQNSGMLSQLAKWAKNFLKPGHTVSVVLEGVNGGEVGGRCWGDTPPFTLHLELGGPQACQGDGDCTHEIIDTGNPTAECILLTVDMLLRRFCT